VPDRGLHRVIDLYAFAPKLTIRAVRLSNSYLEPSAVTAEASGRLTNECGSQRLVFLLQGHTDPNSPCCLLKFMTYCDIHKRRLARLPRRNHKRIQPILSTLKVGAFLYCVRTTLNASRVRG
jgi:hypothetical protein